MIGRVSSADTRMEGPPSTVEQRTNDRFDAGTYLPGSIPAKRASKHESPGPQLANSSPNFLTPRSAEGLEALYALAAAARYAGQHGTPAIQAVLGAVQPGASVTPGGGHSSIEERLKAAGMPPPPSPFAKKPRLEPSVAVDAQGGGDGYRQAPLPLLPAGLPNPPKALSMPAWPQSQLKSALYQLLRQCQLQQASSSITVQPTMQCPPVTAANALLRPPQPHTQAKDVQPSNGAVAFSAIMQALRRHQWTPNEAALLVQFRAKYGRGLNANFCLFSAISYKNTIATKYSCNNLLNSAALLDGVGREIAHMSVIQLQDDKDALLEIIKGIVIPSSSTQVQVPPAKSSSGTPRPQAASGGAPLSLARQHADGGGAAVKMDANEAQGSWQ